MQRYISKELTHFVGGNLREIKDEEQRFEKQYKILIKIIHEKCISSPPHSSLQLPEGMKYNQTYSPKRISGHHKFSSNDMIIPNIVCFCDIPLGDLGVHINKYSPFGLSFKKSFLIERGANPILYVEKNSAIYYKSILEGKSRDSTRLEYLNEMINLFGDNCFPPLKYLRTKDRTPIIGPPREECWFIAEFVLDLLCYVKLFDASKMDNDEDNFYMEREWRTLYDVYFEINDIYRIILPSAFNKRFRNDVPEYTGQITFSEECSSV